MTGTNLKTKAKTPPETRRLGYARVSTYAPALRGLKDKAGLNSRRNVVQADRAHN
jgi:hypothetical protein